MVSEYFFGFAFDKYGRGDLVLLRDAVVMQKIPARTGSIRQDGSLANPIGYGKWLLVGEGRNGCELETHAAAWLVDADGKAKAFWRDDTVSITAARGVRRLIDGIEIVGHARRTTALRIPTRRPPATAKASPRRNSSPSVCHRPDRNSAAISSPPACRSTRSAWRPTACGASSTASSVHSRSGWRGSLRQAVGRGSRCANVP